MMTHELYLTIAEAAVLLRKSPRTVYKWARAGQIPAQRVGRTWYIARHELHMHLSGRRNLRGRGHGRPEECG